MLRSTSRARLTGSHFLSEHVCYVGSLSRDQKQVRGLLAKHDLLIVLGADPVRMSVWSEVEAKPDDLPVLHIGLVDWDMGKNFAAEMAVRADVRETLLALTPQLKNKAASAWPAKPKPRWCSWRRRTGRQSVPNSPSASRAAAERNRSIRTG